MNSRPVHAITPAVPAPSPEEAVPADPASPIPALSILKDITAQSPKTRAVPIEVPESEPKGIKVLHSLTIESDAKRHREIVSQFPSQGLTPNQKTMRRLILAAHEGDAHAQHRLGLMYSEDRAQWDYDRDEERYEQAGYWLLHAAAQDYGRSFLELGYLYSEKNIHIDRNGNFLATPEAHDKEAIFWLNQCLSRPEIDKTEKKRVIRLLSQLHQAQPTAQSKRKGIQFLILSARGDDMDSQYDLGKLYAYKQINVGRNGKLLTTAEDFERESVYWLTRASNNHHIEAQSLLGHAYANGHFQINAAGEKLETQEARDKIAAPLLMKAASNGSLSAQLGMASMLYYDRVKVNIDGDPKEWSMEERDREAVYQLTMAIDQGSVLAKRCLGLMVMDGYAALEITDQDERHFEALLLFDAAVRHGHPFDDIERVLIERLEWLGSLSKFALDGSKPYAVELLIRFVTPKIVSQFLKTLDIEDQRVKGLNLLEKLTVLGAFSLESLKKVSEAMETQGLYQLIETIAKDPKSHSAQDAFYALVNVVEHGHAIESHQGFVALQWLMTQGIPYVAEYVESRRQVSG